MFDVDAGSVVGLALVLMVIGGFACGMVIAIARQIAAQRLAENVFRERLARHWGRLRPGGPPTAA